VETSPSHGCGLSEAVLSGAPRSLWTWQTTTTNQSGGRRVTMFFDKPDFKEALTTWARREVYKRITNDLRGTA
jgi:hypothetical protein